MALAMGGIASPFAYMFIDLQIFEICKLIDSLAGGKRKNRNCIVFGRTREIIQIAILISCQGSLGKIINGMSASIRSSDMSFGEILDMKISAMKLNEIQFHDMLNGFDCLARSKFGKTMTIDIVGIPLIRKLILLVFRIAVGYPMIMSLITFGEDQIDGWVIFCKFICKIFLPNLEGRKRNVPFPFSFLGLSSNVFDIASGDRKKLG